MNENILWLHISYLVSVVKTPVLCNRIYLQLVRMANMAPTANQNVDGVLEAWRVTSR